MLHIFKYRFLCFIKNKTLLFWTLIFPIGLSTLFFFAFSNLGSANQLEPIKVAAVDQGNAEFKTIIEHLGDSNNETQLLNVTFTDETDAKRLLDKGDISAIIEMSQTPSLMFNKKDMNIEILKGVIQSYLRVHSTVSTLAGTNPQVISEQVIADISTNKVIVDSLESKGGSKDMTAQYFYTVIAMTCMYGAFWGLRSISDSQANQSDRAIRLNVAPTPKGKVILIDYFVSLIIMSIELAIVFAYFIGVLHIDFGSHFLAVIGITFCGMLMSLALGIMVGCVSKFKENANIGLISTTTLVSCFFAGMMVGNMPYIVNQYLPWFKYVNPASLITRSFSVLYYYTDISPIYTNMAILLAMSIIFLLISFRVLRRKAYASI